MDKTPKPAKKDKKGKAKAQTNFIDLSSSPTSKSPMTSSVPPNAPKGPSRDQTNKPGETSRAWIYKSPPLPMFSSNNPVDPPRAGANANPLLSVTARSRETERSSYGSEFKIKVLEVCLSLKDQYLAMPPATHADQEPFWKRLVDLLSVMPLTKGKFGDWKDAHKAVEYWCQARRSYMRENRLPALSQSQPALDTLIDQWNLVFAQRFCKIHSGYFANTTWPKFAEDNLKQMVQDEVDGWITKSLKERRDQLQLRSESTLLSSNRSLKDYNNAIKGLQNRFEVAKRDESQVRESEAVMSIVLKLQPGLRTAISQFLGGPTEPTRRTELATGTREQVGVTPCSNETSVPATTSAPPVSSTFSSSKIALPPSTPNTNTTQRPEKPESQRSGPSTQHCGKREEDASRKRKDLEPPVRSTESSGLKGGNMANTGPYDQSKRPRLETRHSPIPVIDTPRGRDTRDPRSPPFRRPRLPSRSPPRGPPGYRNDGDRPGGPYPPRYQDQYRERGHQSYYQGGRHQERDSYRPPHRVMRETTAEFEGMSIQQQNMSLLRQIKKVQDMVEKKN